MGTPTCRKLLLSWLLAAAAVIAMEELGHAGVFGSLLLIPIWTRLRGVHDKRIADTLFRGQGAAPRAAAIYYLLVLIGVGVAVSRGERFEDLSLIGLLVMVMLPVMVAMMVADHAVCRGGKK